MELKFRILNEAATLPSRAHDGDAGLDLHSAQTAHIGPRERWQISTGLAVEIPAGHAGLVISRSGLARRYGISLVNAPGLIDAGYRGEIGVLLLNNDPAEVFRVEPGDRIAQLVVVPISSLEPVSVEELTDSHRGEGGFGSSGR
ncbi:MAG: dUTP diphosphatase [Solirubrobacterales bacterium]